MTSLLSGDARTRVSPGFGNGSVTESGSAKGFSQDVEQEVATKRSVSGPRLEATRVFQIEFVIHP